MTEPSPLWPLPGIADWSFDDVADQDPARAEQLARAGQPAALIDASRAFVDGAETGAVLFGWEFAGKQPSHHRAVVQFRVDPALFDWFFNARTGYRAHYRAHPDQALAFNARLVYALRDQLR